MKQWAEVRGEWILSQLLSSILRKNINRAGDRISNLQLSGSCTLPNELCGPIVIFAIIKGINSITDCTVSVFNIIPVNIAVASASTHAFLVFFLSAHTTFLSSHGLHSHITIVEILSWRFIYITIVKTTYSSEKGIILSKYWLSQDRLFHSLPTTKMWTLPKW